MERELKQEAHFEQRKRQAHEHTGDRADSVSAPVVIGSYTMWCGTVGAVRSASIVYQPVA